MKRYISVLLCLVILAGLLAGCTAAGEPVEYIPVGDELAQEEDGLLTEEAPEDVQEFSLAYFPEQSMNPLSASDFSNRVVISLLYQGLFATNRENEVLPILCKNYTASADLMVYEFTVDPTATFSDGVPVTPEDVVASLQESRNHKYYGRRLRFVNAISVTEDQKVRINLSQPNGNLPLLLDIPIVKAEQIEFENPLGTGPYTLTGWGRERALTRRENWWCQSDDLLLTAEKIPLVSVESAADIRDAFEFYDVGVVCTDPGSDRYVEYRCDYELWDCENGIFVSLGINTESAVFQNPELRRALSKGINRDLLVDRCYRGFAKSASLPASPDSPFYTAPLAKQYAYDPAAYQSAIGEVKGHVKLLVNASDSLRVRVAQEISRMLNTSGFLVEVDARSEGYYTGALSTGDYDLYLGQTKLSPNMDLSAFFAENGPLAYGGMDDIGTYTLCLQALENQGNYYALHQAIMEDGYLCPVVFRSYAVYATRGLLTELKPARDNIFCYSIGRTLTDAYVVQST